MLTCGFDPTPPDLTKAALAKLLTNLNIQACCRGLAALIPHQHAAVTASLCCTCRTRFTSCCCCCCGLVMCSRCPVAALALTHGLLVLLLALIAMRGGRVC